MVFDADLKQAGLETTTIDGQVIKPVEGWVGQCTVVGHCMSHISLQAFKHSVLMTTNVFAWILMSNAAHIVGEPWEEFSRRGS
jgi:hypothetical protein